MASFFDKVVSFNTAAELRTWAVNAGLQDDPTVLKQSQELHIHEAFDDSVKDVLLQAAEQVDGVINAGEYTIMCFLHCLNCNSTLIFMIYVPLVVLECLY